VSKLNGLASLVNGRAIDLGVIQRLSMEALQGAILASVEDGQRVVSLFGVAAADERVVQLYVVIADDQESRLRVGTTTIEGDKFP